MNKKTSKPGLSGSQAKAIAKNVMGGFGAGMGAIKGIQMAASFGADKALNKATLTERKNANGYGHCEPEHRESYGRTARRKTNPMKANNPMKRKVQTNFLELLHTS